VRGGEDHHAAIEMILDLQHEVRRLKAAMQAQRR
jgi:hypothetical protein